MPKPLLRPFSRQSVSAMPALPPLSDKEAKSHGILLPHQIFRAARNDAVLSACETGRGRVRKGTHRAHLSLLYRWGATTVVSQWKVQSSSTTQVMTAFHRAHRANLGQAATSFATARAMREAELQLLHSGQYAHSVLRGFIRGGWRSELAHSQPSEDGFTGLPFSDSAEPGDQREIFELNRGSCRTEEPAETRSPPGQVRPRWHRHILTRSG